MASLKRVSIGFGGGQVAAVRVPQDELGRLRRALSQDESWLELASEDGELILDLRQIVFVKVEGSAATIGFSDA